MRKFLIGLVALLTLLSVAIPSSAATSKKVTFKKFYEGSGVGFAASFARADPTCTDGKNCTLTKDGRIEAGRVKFDPVGGTRKSNTLTVRVVDDNDPYASLTVSTCEDSDQNGSCGTADRQWKKVCIKNGGTIKLYDVKKANGVVVNLQGVYSCTQFVNDLPDSQGMTTQGAVYLSYVKIS